MEDLCSFIQNLYKKHLKSEEIQQKMQEGILIHLIKKRVEGDVLEIGALIGGTTCIFCEAVKNTEKNTYIYVLDPFDGSQEGNENIYQQFKENTKKYNNVIHHRIKSQSREAIEFMNKNKFIYVFIDGLHTHSAALQDLNNVAKNLIIGGVICLDDTTMDGVKLALEEFIQNNKNFLLIEKPSYDINGNEIKNNKDLGVFNPHHKGMEFIVKINEK